jgi:hypothetical protein
MTLCIHCREIIPEEEEKVLTRNIRGWNICRDCFQIFAEAIYDDIHNPDYYQEEDE